MAIDSRRKRASIASLGLAFLGASIVPDGSLAQADRQTVANSYYGIEAGGAFVQIGGTSQLEAFDASGGITLERIIGGTSQLEAYDSSGGITVGENAVEVGAVSQIEAFDSSGGITLERVLGATSQIEAFGSSGGITIVGAVTLEDLQSQVTALQAIVDELYIRLDLDPLNPNTYYTDDGGITKIVNNEFTLSKSGGGGGRWTMVKS